ncbi:DUF6894 family protein [Lichenibacterium dinghuense]|uniref:DUF6894 family protein n=1 Tax=Lichenibacterium dinghuense TaxID=2895977 RepID=UPI001F2D0013|nr:hypothetical protein [Lichenibacterium sp. 6Y81]
MPRYYFDSIDGSIRHVDEHGVDLRDGHEAADHVACLVGTMLTEHIPTAGTRSINVVVRSDDGSTIYVGHGTFHGCPITDDAA